VEIVRAAGRDCAALHHEGTKDTKDHEEQQLSETATDQLFPFVVLRALRACVVNTAAITARHTE
jgi:hypothetical protein